LSSRETASICEATFTVCVVILEENLDHVNVLRSGEGISSDADAERLSQTNIGSLCDRFVRQRAGTGNDACTATSKLGQLYGLGECTDPARLVDMSRLDAHLAPKGIDDARTVGTYEARLGLTLQGIHDL